MGKLTHQFRENGSHYNGGAEFFGYGYDAIGEPRLSMIRRWYRQGERKGQTEDRFLVDGAHAETYEAALEALKSPPTLTADERDRLTEFAEGWPVKLGAARYEIDYALRGKGFIEAKAGYGIITEAARLALSHQEPTCGEGFIEPGLGDSSPLSSQPTVCSSAADVVSKGGA